jgi:hypothetical protein
MHKPFAALLLAALLCSPAAAATIDADQITRTVKDLSSDPFQGRAPGTPGEAVAIDYLVGRLKALGLEPAGPGGSWTQPVPLVRTQVDQPAAMNIKVAGRRCRCSRAARPMCRPSGRWTG